MTTPAVCIAGHGSRDADATHEFYQLVDLFRQRDPERIVELGFLEFATPTIQEGIEKCVQRGAETVSVVPAMLMAGGHAKNDIPSEVHHARRDYSDRSFHYGRHMHLHPKIVQLCQKRIEEAEASSDHDIPREETLLLVVGRGSSDPDGNADVAKLSRMLWEGMGFGWGATCYIGVTKPLLTEALPRLHRLGYKRIITFPFFLFTGILEKRIQEQAAAFAEHHPETEFLRAGYLGPDPMLCEVFVERADEAVEGSPNMNCELCKYRVQLVGFEDEVGAPQAGHHHHVRGIGQDDHHHGHHHHGHHHHHHEHDGYQHHHAH